MIEKKWKKRWDFCDFEALVIFKSVCSQMNNRKNVKLTNKLKFFLKFYNCYQRFKFRSQKTFFTPWKRIFTPVFFEKSEQSWLFFYLPLHFKLFLVFQQVKERNATEPNHWKISRKNKYYWWASHLWTWI